jgi:hypothetical protein
MLTLGEVAVPGVSGSEVESPSELARAVDRAKALLRMVNDHIRALAAGRSATERRAFICECGNHACIDAVELTVADYDVIRANADYFVVAAHRVTDAAGELVARHRGFAVMAPPEEQANELPPTAKRDVGGSK